MDQEFEELTGQFQKKIQLHSNSLKEINYNETTNFQQLIGSISQEKHKDTDCDVELEIISRTIQDPIKKKYQMHQISDFNFLTIDNSSGYIQALLALINDTEKDILIKDELKIEEISCSRALNYILNDHLIPSLVNQINYEMIANPDYGQYLKPQVIDFAFSRFYFNILAEMNKEQ